MIITKVIWRKMAMLKKKNRARLRYQEPWEVQEQAICSRQTSSKSEVEQKSHLGTKEMTLRRLGRIQSFYPTHPRSCLAKKAASRSRMWWTRIYHSSRACLVWHVSLASNHQATFRTTSHNKPAKSLLPHITHTTRSVSVRWHLWSTRTRISP